MVDQNRFTTICAVPRALAESGRSLLEVVQASGYAQLRGQFAVRDLADYLRAHPDVVDTWVAYSKDKRTSEGWYLRPPFSVGRIVGHPPPMREQHYVDLAAACAAFIVAELSDVLDRASAA